MYLLVNFFVSFVFPEKVCVGKLTKQGFIPAPQRGQMINLCLTFHFTSSQVCFSAEELVMIYGLADTSSVTFALGQSGLAQLSPALIQQILSGACTATTESTADPDGLTTAESKSDTDGDIASTCCYKEQKSLVMLHFRMPAGFNHKALRLSFFYRIHLCNHCQCGHNSDGLVWHCGAAVYLMYQRVPDVYPVLHQLSCWFSDWRCVTAPATRSKWKHTISHH